MTPFVPQFTPEELAAGKEYMKTTSPDDIERAYRMNQITLRDKVLALRAYGQLQREIAVRGDMAQKQAVTTDKNAAVSSAGGGYKGAAVGEVKYYVQNVVKEFQASWDAATREGPSTDPTTGKMKTGPSKGEAALHGLMGALEALKIYDLPGNIVERWALEAGVTPGLARAANWAVWIPTNFVGIGALLKAPLKVAGAGVRGVKAGTKAISANLDDLGKWLADPVAYAAREAAQLDSKAAIAAAKTAATKVAGDVGKVVKAVSEDELRGGKIVTKAAEPAGISTSGAQVQMPFIETPQDVERMTMIELVNHYDRRAQAMSRKVTSHEMTRAEAQAAPLNFEEVINRQPGEPISAAIEQRIASVHEQVKKGFDAVLQESAKQVDEIAAGNAPDMATAFKAHLQAIELTNPAFLGALSEAGRGLEYAKTFNILSGESRLLDSVLKSLGGNAMKDGSDAAVADAIQKLTMLTAQGRDTFLKEAAKTTYSPDIKHSLFKTLLFLSPSTHMVNIVSGQAMVGGKMLEKTAQSLMPFSAGGPTLDQTKAMWAGMFSALSNVPRAWRQAIERSGHEMEKYGLEGAQDVLAKYGTGRLLAMEDEFISAPLESALIQSAAIGRMLEKKLPTKVEQAQFLDNLLNDAGKVAQLKEEVAPEVAETMFRAPLSAWGEQGAKWIRNSPMDFWLPIIKFPINALKVARDWTPGVQVLSKKFADEIAEGGAKEVAARTRMTLAWMNANMIWSGTKAGVITGGGPKDPELRKEWLAAGNVPYAINGLPIRWMEPFGTVIGAIADMAEVSNQMDSGDVEDFIGGASLVLGRAIENNYWVRVLEGLTSVVTDVKQAQKFEETMKAATKFILNPVTTVVTGGPIGSRIREQFDPEVKDIRTLADFYKSKVPGYSKDVRPQLNYSGEARYIPPVLGQRWLSFFAPPFRTPDAEVDPVAKFLTKHELQVNDTWKSYGGIDPDKPLETPTGQSAIGVTLSGDESHDWKKLSLTAARRLVSGKTWVETIADLDADPEFNNLPKFKKQQKVSLLWSKYKDMGFDMLKGLNQDVFVRTELAKTLTKTSKGKVPFAADAPDGVEVSDSEPIAEPSPPIPSEYPEAPQ